MVNSVINPLNIHFSNDVIFPDEIIDNILIKFNDQCLLRMAQTCKRIYNFIEKNNLYSSTVNRYFKAYNNIVVLFGSLDKYKNNIPQRFTEKFTYQKFSCIENKLQTKIFTNVFFESNNHKWYRETVRESYGSKEFLYKYNQPQVNKTLQEDYFLSYITIDLGEEDAVERVIDLRQRDINLRPRKKKGCHIQ